MDTGQRCPAVPLPHYAVMRLGRYAQLQKIVFPQPYYLGELTEERAKGVWDWLPGAPRPGRARRVQPDFLSRNKAGRGQPAQLHPSHTTVRTGPYTAVREVALTRLEQGWETERFEVC